jgi:nucleoside-diphosphate-sugar epimerase
MPLHADPILITGATGFVGHALCVRLRGEGREVIGVSRSSSGPHVRGCDLQDAEAVARLFAELRPGTVFHLASQVTGSRDLDAVLSTFHANAASAVHLMAAAARHGGPRVVLAGSMEELPSLGAPRYPYAASKRVAAEYAAMFASAFGLPVCNARLGMIYGPGQRAMARLVPHVIREQLAGRRPQLSRGTRRVDWVYIDDVVDGLLTLANQLGGDAAGQSLAVGSGQAVSVAEIAQLLSRITGGPAPELGALPDRFRDPDIELDVEQTARIVGWRAVVTLEEGLRRSVEWYRDALARGEL